MELALELANRSPTDPRTLTRAARDFKDTNPAFAIEAGLPALRWLGEGYGYEVTGADVWAAYSRTIDAAERLGAVTRSTLASKVSYQPLVSWPVRWLGNSDPRKNRNLPRGDGRQRFLERCCCG